VKSLQQKAVSRGYLRVNCAMRRPLQICCPPPRIAVDVMVDAKATIRDLKQVAAKTLAEIFPPLAGFEVRSLWVDGAEDEDAESDEKLVCQVEDAQEDVLGVEVDGTAAVYDLAAEDVAAGVRCSCGARDDDGERMVACDACDVWLHSRCIGLLDDADIATDFLLTAVTACPICGKGGAATARNTMPTYAADAAADLAEDAVEDVAAEMVPDVVVAATVDSVMCDAGDAGR
jgi:hypothetical protein